MPSPVKKSTPLIKGQSSLSGFFSNGRLSLAESSNNTTPSPQKGGGDNKAGLKEKTKSSKEKVAYTGPPVQEVKEKVRSWSCSTSIYPM